MGEVPKIMVVDDEAGICRNVEKILGKNHFEVVQARSAEEALEKMARESFSLLISDIVMPEMNGLELLKLVKKEWPLTKAVMMTAYASTDTAMKAIRLGALDYIPKPFTPVELRSTVDKALSGELKEVILTKTERESVEVIDVDIPFDREETAKYTSEDYVDRLTRSDIPETTIAPPETLENYCAMGDMICEIFKKLGTTCKAGIKTNACPQKKAKKKKAKKTGFDGKKMIGIDLPFDYEEVVAVTGPEYVEHMVRDGFAYLPYEELKKQSASKPAKKAGVIDVDIPFDREETAKHTSEDYVDRLTKSDIPEATIASPETLENYCAMGDMICEIFKKLGTTCKAGIKTNACPQKKAKKKKAKKTGFDAKKMISIDFPFDYEEIVAVTGPEYVKYMDKDGFAFLPYEELKKIWQEDLQVDRANIVEYEDLKKGQAVKEILVIDDEVAVNNNIRKILAKKGYQVDQAVTKAEAIEKINRHLYALVLLDLRIPGVNGLELLKIVSETQPDAKVIIITGYASIETAVEAARIGAVDYLPKPFTPDEIRTATDKAFSLAA